VLIKEMQQAPVQILSRLPPAGLYSDQIWCHRSILCPGPDMCHTACPQLSPASHSLVCRACLRIKRVDSSTRPGIFAYTGGDLQPHPWSTYLAWRSQSLQYSTGMWYSCTT
jgi:hypothetical protein